jgi:hypothetical protein
MTAAVGRNSIDQTAGWRNRVEETPPDRANHAVRTTRRGI